MRDSSDNEETFVGGDAVTAAIGPKRPRTLPLPVHRTHDSDSAYVFHPDARKLIAVNPVGEGVLSLSSGEWTVDQIVDEIASHFSRDRDQVFEDVRAFLEQMREHGVIEWA